MSDRLFDLGAELVTRNRAADANRVERDCWHYCGHASMTVHTDISARPGRERYKLCHLSMAVPGRIYPGDRLCKRHVLRVSSPPPKPKAKGWEDY